MSQAWIPLLIFGAVVFLIMLPEILWPGENGPEPHVPWEDDDA